MPKIYKDSFGRFYFDGEEKQSGTYRIEKVGTKIAVNGKSDYFDLLPLTEITEIQKEDDSFYSSIAEFEQEMIPFFSNAVEVYKQGLSFEQQVSMGMIPGYSWVDKFGKNPDVDTGSTPEDLWEYQGLYSWGNDNGDDLYISSSNAADNQEIELLVWQLDGSGNWNVSNINATLNGQTPVLVASNVVRCHRMQNEADFGNDLQGNCYAYYDNTDVVGGVPQTDSNVLSVIINGANQTKQLTYTIPTGYVGFLIKGESGITKSSGTDECDFAYKSRRFGKLFKQKKDYGVMTSGNNYYQEKRSFPDPLPAKTDLTVEVVNVSANNMSAWGTFDIMLVEEEYLSNDFLNSIGQIRRV